MASGLRSETGSYRTRSRVAVGISNLPDGSKCYSNMYRGYCSKCYSNMYRGYCSKCYSNMYRGYCSKCYSNMYRGYCSKCYSNMYRGYCSKCYSNMYRDYCSKCYSNMYCDYCSEGPLLSYNKFADPHTLIIALLMLVDCENTQWQITGVTSEPLHLTSHFVHHSNNNRR